MVFADLSGWSAQEASERLGEHGVLADPTPWGLRFVWHLDRTDEDVEAAAAVVRKGAAD